MMSKNKDVQSLDQSTSSGKENLTCCLAAKSRTSSINPRPGSVKYRQEPEFPSSKSKSVEVRKRYKTSLHRKSSCSDESSKENQVAIAGIHINEDKIFLKPEFFVNDCWRTSSDEIPVKFVEIVREEDGERASSDLPGKRFDLEDMDTKSPPYTKEFHLLTEVQKAKIFTAVEDAIKKLSCEDYYRVAGEEGDKPTTEVVSQGSVERFLCKKFLLPWVIMKVVEMVLCHIIQLTFLSEESYFQRKQEFLPVVVTYYLTLFIVVVSLVGHISCFSYSGLQNPCYFMGIISSSILMLTTTLGIFILLSSMEYYRSFLEILVLIFIGGLLCLLFAELCLCYVQVKNIWNRVGQSDQYYTA